MRRSSNSSIGVPNEVDTAVTKLLRTTKALLESLPQWSNMQTSKSEIFEVHDTLERQFFIVSQAFEESNISTTDLLWIPGKLRESISMAMIEQPSQAALDQYLPRIRDVIVHLLHGLKGKQAQLRERDRESRGSMRSNSEPWSREIPLSALSRGSSTSSSRLMMYPSSSPPLPPMTSPRMTGEETRGRNSIPSNDLSARIVPRRSYSPSPQALTPLPTKSTSSTRRGISIPQPQPVPSPPRHSSPPRNTSPPRNPSSSRGPSLPLSNSPNPQPSFDENDPSTANALAALKRQENLARRSSVRRASMYRGDHTVAPRSQDTPPVPSFQKSQLGRTLKEEAREHGLVLFLQIGKQIKKTVYQGELSIPALNMLFVETFSYTSRQNDFPTIYIRDPAIGVSYELVNLNEVKSNSVLSLNIDEKEEQREIQKELVAELSESFQKEMKETTQLFTEQIEQVKKQFESSHETLLEQIKAHTPTNTDTNITKEQYENEKLPTQKIDQEQVSKQFLEIESLKRDIIVLRQVERESKEEISQLVQQMKKMAEEFSKSTIEKESKTISARLVLEEGKKNLLEKSDRITTRLEDLQDTVDQLKLDVTQRKSRPSEVQMTHCAKERKELLNEIKEFDAFMIQVKPKWKKTWEHELQTIVKEQQDLKDHEYLLTDIKDDLDALSEVFEQLEKIHAYQINTKPIMREYRAAPVEDGFDGMSSVLQQVSTIDVDHDRRLRAMEQAEKMRQRELANRVDDFEKELSTFVDTKKLKKTGGALEIDRLRKLKDEELIKQNYVSKLPKNTEDENEEIES